LRLVIVIFDSLLSSGKRLI